MDIASASSGSDDEGDINWEDGDTAIHTMEVERTLETMRVTGGLNEGSIEINFEASEAPQEINSEGADHSKAREGFGKVMTVIVTRAMPLISRWARALMQADSLVSSDISENALVQMTATQCAVRKNALERLIELKRRLVRLIASAQRLGVESAQPRMKPADPQPRESTLLLGGHTKRSQGLHEKLSQRKKLGNRFRSNKIQIKYRKDL
jgi:hypothetical protein